MTVVQKLCCVCGEDVAGKKRMKDPNGQYYCEPCYTSKLSAASQSRAGTPVGAPHVPAPPPLKAPPPPPPPEDDGLLDLLPETKPVQEKVAMLGCARCKKLVPERQTRNVDGEFICLACFAKQGQPSRGAAPKAKAGKAAKDETHERSSDGFAQSLAGGMLISGGVLVAFGFAMLALHYFLPEGRDRSLLLAVVTAVVETIFLVVRAGALLVSMIIAARMLGGISFGYIGSALYKSLGLFAVVGIIEIFLNRSESLFMFGFGFRGIALVLAFIALFHIDFFEAVILSVVNFFIGIGLTVAMGAMILFAGAMFAGGSADDEDLPRRPGTHHVRPANDKEIDMPAPDAAPAQPDQPADNAVPPG